MRIFVTDGSALENANRGVGGYAYLEITEPNKPIVAEGLASTTSNRAELLAILKVLEATPGDDVTIFCDSLYVVDNVQRLLKWESKGWRNSSGAVANKDLWEEYQKFSAGREVVVKWIGHGAEASLRTKHSMVDVHSRRAAYLLYNNTKNTRLRLESSSTNPSS